VCSWLLQLALQADWGYQCVSIGNGSCLVGRTDGVQYCCSAGTAQNLLQGLQPDVASHLQAGRTCNAQMLTDWRSPAVLVDRLQLCSGCSACCVG
jgi:hypothetical protein